MGKAAADDMLEHGGFDRALSWHLRSNHYPPVPTYMIPIAKKAIELAKEGQWQEPIELPDGVTFRESRTATSVQVVESYHLSAFVDHHEEEE